MAIAPESGRVAVAVSGGMDSLYALLSLQRQGLDVCAVHGRFLAPGGRPDPVPVLERQCRQLGVPLFVEDLREAFARNVVRPFVEAYASGSTPNPCVWCNARIKFGLLFDAARAHGAQTLATGHYARVRRHPVYGTALCRGDDPVKDQSYFLAGVPRESLAAAVFPLADKHKAEIAAELEALGLEPPLPGESQEICFVPDDAYRSFLQVGNVSLSGPGPILLEDGERVGTHGGLWQYTQGQRRGLGIAWHEPLYVLDKDVPGNALVVGGKAALRSRGCTGGEANILAPPALWPETLFAQVRYRQKAVPAVVTCEQNRLTVLFDEPQAPAAPGQLLTVYDAAGYVLAGATIDAVLR